MCNHHRPVCVKCQIDMRPEKNGVFFVEDDGLGNDYKLWSTDKWKCPECGNQVLLGFGVTPCSLVWDSDFTRQVALAKEEPSTIREKWGGVTHD